MKPQALTNDEFKKFVEEFKKASRIELVSSGIRTASTREIAGGDNDKREEQLDNVNKNLEAINATLVTLTKKFTGTIEKTSQKISDKLAQIEKVGTFSPVSKIKDNRPVTMREELKSGVAGVKRFGSSLADMGSSAFRNIKAFAKDPLQATRVGLEKAGRGVEKGYSGIGAGIKDIFGTSKDYTVEGGRFAEAFTKSPRGGLMQGKKTGFDVGLTKFNEMQAKEEEIKKLEEEIAISTRQGFEAPKGKSRELEKLKSEFVELDPRKKIAPIETKVETPKIETAPIETKKVDSLIVDQYGKPLQRDQTVEEAKVKKEELQTTAPNQNKGKLILPTGFQTEKSSSAFPSKETFSEKLVKLTEKSLAELKNISKSLGVMSTTPQQQPQQQTGGGSGGGSGDGSGGGSRGRGIGSRILRGLGTAARVVGGGLLTAGKVVGGALLSKPALIAGGVALAGYGAYKGYQAIKGAFSGGDEKTPDEVITEEKQTEGQVSGRQTILDSYQKQIDEGKITPEQAIEQVKEFTSNGTRNGGQPFLDDAIKQFQPQIGRAAKGGDVKAKESTGSSYGDAVNKRTDELLAKAPANLRDDPGYQRRKRQQAELEVKEGKTLKGEPLSQVQSSQQAPVAQKAGFGDKVGSFFGGIKDSVVGAAGKVGAVVGTAGAAVGSFASGLKDKVTDTAQYLSEEYDRDLSATANTDKLDAEVDKRMKEAGVEPFSQEANNIRKQVRKEMEAEDPNAFMMSEMLIGSEASFKEDSVSAGKKYDLSKDKLESGITAQKSLFGSSFLGSMFSKKGQRTGQFLSESENQEVLLANEAELGLGSDLPVEYKKRSSSSLLGERISSGSMFKRDKYNVTDTESGQDLNVTKDEYNKLEALVAEGKAEEAQKLFDEINAREAAYVPEEGITPEEQMVAPSKGASNLATVRDTTVENAAMREEMAATQDIKPVVVNTTNAVNSNTQTFTPMRTTPRHNNSSFERKQNEAAYYGT